MYITKYLAKRKSQIYKITQISDLIFYISSREINHPNKVICLEETNSEQSKMK